MWNFLFGKKNGISQLDNLVTQYRRQFNTKTESIPIITKNYLVYISSKHNKVFNISVRKGGPGRPIVYSRDKIPQNILDQCINTLQRSKKQWS